MRKIRVMAGVSQAENGREKVRLIKGFRVLSFLLKRAIGRRRLVDRSK